MILSKLGAIGKTISMLINETNRAHNSWSIVMAINIETVRVNNFEMDYCRFGHGEKTFVILPGLSVQSVMPLAEVVAEAYSSLAEEYTVYLFDRRKEIPDTYAVQDMARDTIAAFKALGLEDVYLFGASQGGMIAMTIAIEEPNMVRKLVLGSTAARMNPERYRKVEEWVQLAKDGNAEELYLAFGKAVYPDAVYEQYKGFLAESAKSVTKTELGRFIILAEGMKGFDVTSRLKEITCPVLVLGARDDKVLGGDASEEIAEKIGCDVYMYEGYGHAAYDLAPDYRERIKHFLD